MLPPEFSEEQYFSRHFRLPSFTVETQRRLRAARVLTVGMGGLGCPIALYLAGAGVGTIGICDSDIVSVANLHRQILFDTSDIGLKKVEVAARRLRAVNPFVDIVEIHHAVTEDNVMEWVGAYDIIVDATDNHTAKYLLDDACRCVDRPLIFGSIFQFEGRVSVFHVPTDSSPRGFSYRDLYSTPPPAGLSQDCGEAGVIGVLPGIIGMLQANEVIKLITGLGTTLAGTLLIFDALAATTRRLTLSPDVRTDRQGMGEESLVISHHQAGELSTSGSSPVFVDVREPAEMENRVHGALHIPLGSLPERLDELPRDRDLVLYCHSGVRSSRGALYLQSLGRFSRVYSLEGGIKSPGAAARLTTHDADVGI